MRWALLQSFIMRRTLQTRRVAHVKTSLLRLFGTGKWSGPLFVLIVVTCRAFRGVSLTRMVKECLLTERSATESLWSHYPIRWEKLANMSALEGPVGGTLEVLVDPGVVTKFSWGTSPDRVRESVTSVVDWMAHADWQMDICAHSTGWGIPLTRQSSFITNRLSSQSKSVLFQFQSMMSLP